MAELTGTDVRATMGFTVLEGGRVAFGDGVEPFDLSTLEGMARAEAALDDGQLAELRALMRGRGFILAGGVFKAADDYGKTRDMHAAGPASTKEGMTSLDEDLGAKVFEPAGVPNPYNANTTPKLRAQIKDAPQFTAAVDSYKQFLGNPTPRASADFESRMRLLEARFPDGNLMEVLFLVFKSSIREVNEDKKYFLQKLQMYNKMGEALSDYLTELVGKQTNLSEKKTPEMSAGEKEDQITVVTQYELDTSALLSNGDANMREVKTEEMKQTDLNIVVKELENQQENLRNKRQMAQTSFTNFDQKSNQNYNLMSTTVKTMNEMRHAPIKNLL